MNQTQKAATKASFQKNSSLNTQEPVKEISKPVASWFRGEASLCVVEA